MALTTILKSEDIRRLGQDVSTKAGELRAMSDSIRTQVTRAEEFQGTSADNYDQFLAEWAAHQAKMIEAMEQASQLLLRLADNTEALDQGAFSAR